jgi:hypothetical protein
MEVLSLVIGVVGLLVGIIALAPILQIYFGAPIITFQPSKMSHTGYVALVMKLINPPVERPLLKMLGVKRDAVEVLSDFAIFRKADDKLVCKVSPALLNSPDGTQANIVKLPPIFPALVLVILFDDGKPLIPDLINNKHTPIPPGCYWIRLRAIAAHRTYETQRDFEIGATTDVSKWL